MKNHLHFSSVLLLTEPPWNPQNVLLCMTINRHLSSIPAKWKTINVKIGFIPNNDLEIIESNYWGTEIVISSKTLPWKDVHYQNQFHKQFLEGLQCFHGSFQLNTLFLPPPLNDQLQLDFLKTHIAQFRRLHWNLHYDRIWIFLILMFLVSLLQH